MSELIVIDGVYVLRQQLGKGGMATVYLADVDLLRFDYTTLYAYTQVQGATHTERRQKAEELAEVLRAQALDLATVRAILSAQNIPIPAAQVAVKVSTAGEALLARFEGEWKNLMCLNHDNVVKVYGGGVYQGRPYYAMELLTNLVPPKHIRDEFSIAEKLHIVMDSARGLGYLHANGIVHRDVKPDNLVTCEVMPGEFVTKVTDLGLAKNVDEDLGMTATNAVMGTPYYMSPEQVASSKKVDHRADIYSLGATLYEFVTGFRPYHDKTTVYEIISAVSRGDVPVPPQQHNAELPDPICSIIACAMARDPAERYQSMEDFVGDLEHYVGEENPEITSSVNYAAVGGAKVTAGGGKAMYGFQRLRLAKAKRQAARIGVQDRTGAAVAPVAARAAAPAPPSAGNRNHVATIAVLAALVVGLVLWIVFGSRPAPTAADTAKPVPAATAPASAKPPAAATATARSPAVPVASPAAAPKPVAALPPPAVATPSPPVARPAPEPAPVPPALWSIRVFKGKWPATAYDLPALPGDAGKILAAWPAQTKGLFVFCGPEGSGITSGLSALCKAFLKGAEGTVVSVEPNGPETFVSDKLGRIEIIAAAGRSVPELLRAAAAMEPTVLLIEEAGESLDPEVVKATCEAARNHLVATNIHVLYATDVPRAFADHGALPALLAEALGGVLNQHLVYKICTACKEPDPAPVLDLLNGLPDEAALRQAKYFRGRGCAACGNSGVKGRDGIQELLPLTPEIRALIGKNVLSDELRAAALRAGMVPCVQPGVARAAKGEVSLETLRWALPGTLPPTTKAEFDAAVKAWNPEYDGKGYFRADDAKMVYINLENCGRIADLTPLRGIPLKSLDIYYCPVTDLTPLADMLLEDFTFDPARIAKGLDVVRHMTSIKTIGPDLQRRLTPAEFWKKYDAGEFGKPGSAPAPAAAGVTAPARTGTLPTTKAELDAVLKAKNPTYNGKGEVTVANGQIVQARLRECGAPDLTPLTGLPLTVFTCRANQVTDLTPLRGMPLTMMTCEFNQVTDLAPLAGMHLTKLGFGANQVASLAPLKGMPLTVLWCFSNRITDLSPLQGMPLTQLYCGGNNITDLTPLAGMKLTALAFDAGKITRGLEVIRAMPTLTRIANRAVVGAPEMLFDAGEFWKKYDANEFGKLGEPPAPQPRWANGCVLAYSFGKNTIREQAGQHYIRDLSGNGNDGHLDGGTFATGPAGDCLALDGKDGGVTVPDSDSLDITGALTIAVWVRPDFPSAPQEWGIVNKYDGPGGKRAYGLFVGDKERKLDRRPSLTVSSVGAPMTGGLYACDTPLDNRAWHHVVAVFVPGQFTVMVVDGEDALGAFQVGTPATGIAVNDLPLLIGKDYQRGYGFNGMLAEVAIWRRVLPPDEVKALYTYSLAGKSYCEVIGQCRPQAATPPAGKPWTNSLGMEFVPVPGTQVLFSKWETRVQDYRVFSEETKREWPKPDFAQEPTHPAVNISWDDAQAFCKWLTEKEQKAGKLRAGQKYRLPTDLEWSAAVGLKEETGDTPAERHGKAPTVYPWGTEWPPPKGAGNYQAPLRVDDFATTAPVGSFAPNQYGIFDLGGNAWEWCEDYHNGRSGARVLRGAAWSGNADGMPSAYRGGRAPDTRLASYGFRCVVVTAGP